MTTLLILTSIFFILLQSFFNGIEIGLVSLRRPRVDNGIKKGERHAIILGNIIKRPSLMLSTVLFGTNFSIVCASIAAEKSAASLGFSSDKAILATTIIMTAILFIGEVVPKNWFRQAPYDRCSRYAELLNITYYIMLPPSWILARFTDLSVKILSRHHKEQDARILIREDFRLFLRESEEGGIIDPCNANILDKAVDFHRLSVSDVMIPADAVASIHANATVTEAVAACRDSGFARLPVRGDDNKEWIGVFSIYDAIHKLPEEQWATRSVASIMRKPAFINTNANLADMVSNGKASSPLLIVVDEHRTQTGIATPIDVVNYLFRK